MGESVIRQIQETDLDFLHLNSGCLPNILFLTSSPPNLKGKIMKHKHAELIKAWADGAEIQERWVKLGCRVGGEKEWSEWSYFDGEWADDSETEYRIKPTPKPDVVKGMYVFNYGAGTVLGLNEDTHNLRMTFDGETGELKSAEVIK